MKRWKQFKLHTKLIILAASIPLALTLIMHIGNSIHLLFPNININPDNIGNSEWFAFSGSFFGGAFTLAALVYTIEHGKRTKSHELQLQKIEQEECLIGDVLSSLNPLLLHSLLAAIENLSSTPESGYNQDSVSSILREIRSEQTRLYQHGVRLSFQSYILSPCQSCIHSDECEISTSKTEFSTLFSLISNRLHEGLNDCYDHLSNLNRYYTAKLLVVEYDRLIANKPDDVNFCVSKEKAQSIIDKINLEESYAKIEQLFTDLDSLYKNEVQNLSIAGKKYVIAKKVNADNRLNYKPYFEYKNLNEQ